jgi:cation transport regulator ChaB
MAIKSSVRKSTKRKSSNGLSPRTKKATDTLPSHAQHIYTKIQKRTRTLSNSAHKVAWAAVKKAGYKKEGDKWEKI